MIAVSGPSRLHTANGDGVGVAGPTLATGSLGAVVTAWLAIQFQLAVATTVLIGCAVVCVVGATAAALAAHQAQRRARALQREHEAFLVSNQAHIAALEKRLDSIVELQAISAPKLALPRGGFELYLQYRRLPVADFTRLLDDINSLHRLIVGFVTSDELTRSEKSSVRAQVQLVYADADDFLKLHPDQALAIDYVHTGQSIRIGIKPGWLPTLGVRDGDPEIKLPRVPFYATLTGAILFSALTKGAATAKDATEAVKNIYECRNLALEREKLERELEAAGPARAEMDELLRRTRSQVLDDQNITGFELDLGSGP